MTDDTHDFRVEDAVLAREEEHNSVMLVLWHDGGRCILVLDDDGAFRPLDTDSGSTIADWCERLVRH